MNALTSRVNTCSYNHRFTCTVDTQVGFLHGEGKSAARSLRPNTPSASSKHERHNLFFPAFAAHLCSALKPDLTLSAPVTGRSMPPTPPLTLTLPPTLPPLPSLPSVLLVLLHGVPPSSSSFSCSALGRATGAWPRRSAATTATAGPGGHRGEQGGPGGLGGQGGEEGGEGGARGEMGDRGVAS